MSMAPTPNFEDANPLLDLPMRGYQRLIVALTFILMSLDGFDVLAISFAAPGIGREWELDHTALGILISAGLAGMGVGSLVSGGLADRFGRRSTVILNLLMMTAGMLVSAASRDVVELSVLRFVTGLGIGGMVVALNPIAAEFSNRRWRVLSVSLMAIGFPVGGMIGGAAAGLLLEHYTWRSIFLSGGLFSLGMVPVVVFLVPESLALLSAKPSDANLIRVNRIMGRCGHAPLQAFAMPDRLRASALRELFTPGMMAQTALLTAAYFFFFITDFFFIGWIPQMAVDRGFEPSTAAYIAALCNLGGIVGGVVLGVVSSRIGLKPLGVLACWMTSATVILFAAVPAQLELLILLATVTGFFLFAGIVALYGAVPQVFPPTCRGSGAGLALGIGRIGAILGPLASGKLFALEFPTVTVSFVMAIGSAIAGLIFLKLRLDTGLVSRPRAQGPDIATGGVA